jgi:fumarylacetoacetase
MRGLDATHDPGLRSWVESANRPGCDFPIQNLPLGVFGPKGCEPEDLRVGVGIGDRIVDVLALRERGLLDGDAAEAARACAGPTLNPLMAMPPRYASSLRRALSDLLASGKGDQDRIGEALVAMDDCDLGVPADVGDYTDFYCSLHHATNVGSMFRPDNPLLPNYKHLPIGYHGRSSSIVASGVPVRRPRGQSKGADEPAPRYGPTRLLDYELEVGFFVGPGNDLGGTIPIADAESHIFGFCLVNDWSARDVQAWEYQPLGPFLAKSFMTSVSPWVVTADALRPFRVPAFERAADDPRPLPHLDSADNRAAGGLDLTLEVHLGSRQMRERDLAPLRLSRGNFRHMYWTAAQMLTHHASNGCNLRAGDLIRHRQRRDPQLRLERQSPGRFRGHQHLSGAARRDRQRHRPGGQLPRHPGRRGRMGLQRRADRCLQSGSGRRQPRRLRAGQRQHPHHQRQWRP